MTPADRSTLRDHLAALMGDLDQARILARAGNPAVVSALDDIKASVRALLGYIGRDEAAARGASETARVSCPAPTILYPAPIDPYHAVARAITEDAKRRRKPHA